eukprot:6475141-Amphidinium_carterae.1
MSPAAPASTTDGPPQSEPSMVNALPVISASGSGLGSLDRQIDGCRNVIALPAHEKPKVTSRWIMDTGTGEDLTGERTASEEMLALSETSTRALHFATANGVVASDQVYLQKIKALGNEIAEVRILPDSPNALSAGKRIMHHGHGMTWWPGERPTWYLPTGEKR